MPNHSIEDVTSIIPKSHPSKPKSVVHDTNLSKEAFKVPSKKKEGTQPKETIYVPHAPFPDMLVLTNKAKHIDEINVVFQNVHINIPFFTTIKQIPSYAEFLKDLCIVKRRKNVLHNDFIVEQSTSVIQ